LEALPLPGQGPRWQGNPSPWIVFDDASVRRDNKLMTSQQTDLRIPEAASAWKKDTLDYLNAEYDKNVCTDFAFDNLKISVELGKGKSPSSFPLSLMNER
jgi:hypothetical protein